MTNSFFADAQITPSAHTGPVSAEDVAKMPLLCGAINESLRCYSAAPNTRRFATEELELGGYRIPAGSSIILDIWAMHRCDLVVVCVWLFNFVRVQQARSGSWARTGSPRGPASFSSFGQCTGVHCVFCVCRGLLRGFSGQQQPQLRMKEQA